MNSKKVALVTGGARGIGAGIVRCFVQAGYKVMICDIGYRLDSGDWNYEFSKTSDMEDLKQELSNVDACFVDVTSSGSCLEAVEKTVARFGQLDVLINNAGVVDSGPIDSFDENIWDKIFAVNTKGIFLMSKAALPELRKSSDACIINTASIAGKAGYPNMSAYCGSKFAAIGVTQSFAAELAPEGIRVNAICPGMVGTSMWLEHLLPTNAIDQAQKLEEFEKMMEERIPLGRSQSAQDMGEAVLYLTQAKNVTGVSLSVSGGFQMN
jgi:meso-butanediol dehydrogenase/(S,S)-butanediol dehydrogenase/diacetyl reductase